MADLTNATWLGLDPDEHTPEQLQEMALALQASPPAAVPPQTPAPKGVLSPLERFRQMQTEALAGDKAGIDVYEKSLNNLLSQGSSGIDFTPLAALADSWSGKGGNAFTQAAQASKPMSEEQRIALATKLQDELQKRRGDYTKAQLESAKTDLMYGLNKEKLAKEKAPTSDQSKAALFGKRMEQAEEVFGKLSSEGFDPTSSQAATQRIGLYPEVMKSGKNKQQDQAERNFINAVLRRESGAAINKDEFASGEVQYFPRIGDTPEVLAQKKANRDLAIEALKAESGAAWGRIGGAPAKKTKPKPQLSEDPAMARLQELRKKFGK